MPTGYPGTRPLNWRTKNQLQARLWKRKNKERCRLIKAEWRRKNRLVIHTARGMGITVKEARLILGIEPPDKSTAWYRFWFEDKV
jgi:hypothetical protein